MVDFIVGDRVRWDDVHGAVTGVGGGLVDVDWDNGVHTCPLKRLVERIEPDWSKPVEAYHPDGRVVAVEVRDRIPNGYVIKPPIEENYSMFRLDGLYASCGELTCDWRIRNRVGDAVEVEGCTARDASEPAVSPELVERMVAIVREFAGDDYKHNCGPIWSQVRSLAADLPPEPVDPVLVRAREICAEAYDDQMNNGWATGEWDDGPAMRAVMIALREGMGDD